jgi:hypothetical protein
MPTIADLKKNIDAAQVAADIAARTGDMSAFAALDAAIAALAEARLASVAGAPTKSFSTRRARAMGALVQVRGHSFVVVGLESEAVEAAEGSSFDDMGHSSGTYRYRIAACPADAR